ncbi:hypothetical protein GCM10025787_47130 [Saccharopolyspora rosea]
MTIHNQFRPRPRQSTVATRPQRASVTVVPLEGQACSARAAVASARVPGSGEARIASQSAKCCRRRQGIAPGPLSRLHSLRTRNAAAAKGIYDG